MTRWLLLQIKTASVGDFSLSVTHSQMLALMIRT